MASKKCWECGMEQSGVWRKSKLWSPGDFLCNKCGTNETRGKPSRHATPVNPPQEVPPEAPVEPQKSLEDALEEEFPVPKLDPPMDDPDAVVPDPIQEPAPKAPAQAKPKAAKAKPAKKEKVAKTGKGKTPPNELKECPKCHEEKPMKEGFGYRVVPFGDDTKEIDQSQCRECRKEAAAKANAKAREKRKEIAAKKPPKVKKSKPKKAGKEE